MLGSIIAAFGTAIMAALTSFNPFPVLITSTGSSAAMMPFRIAFFKPANAVEPAGSEKFHSPPVPRSLK